MSLCEQIERAFGHRLRPNRLVEVRGLVTPEQKDALWFSGRDWQEIVWHDWETYRDAFYAFTPKAFIYYLPSILSLATRNPGEWLYAADAFLSILDRSPNPDYWDSFIEKRLVGLETEEYEAIKAWILSLSGTNIFGDEDTIARSYETVDLLQREYSSTNMSCTLIK